MNVVSSIIVFDLSMHMTCWMGSEEAKESRKQEKEGDFVTYPIHRHHRMPCCLIACTSTLTVCSRIKLEPSVLALLFSCYCFAHGVLTTQEYVIKSKLFIYGLPIRVDVQTLGHRSTGERMCFLKFLIG